MPPSLDASVFASDQIELLNEELQAELAENREVTASHAPKALARAGLAIVNLSVTSQRTGLGGKTLLSLELDSAVAGSESSELPSRHGFRVGDIARLAEQPKGGERKIEKDSINKNGANGVVVKITQSILVLALDREDDDVPSGKLWLLKLANDVTYRRMNLTMARLQKAEASDQSSLTRVLLGHSSPTSLSTTDGKSSFLDPSLNSSQQEAIRFALASQDIALIHGPPGTGKTHTLIELIMQLVKRDLRVLVCGPSNISVDNIVERLAPHRIPMLRLGHPARLLPAVLNHSLELRIKSSDAAALVQDIRKEMDDKQASIDKTRSGIERRAIYGEMKELRKEYKSREANCVSEIVRQSKVVCATLHGAGGYHLKHQTFDVVVIDEASQALEAACWIPILNGGATKLILAGDHLQLPPTIKSTGRGNAPARTKTPKHNLETTLFDRMLDLYGDSIKRMLTVQYRMHERIMTFPSVALYDSKLIAADAVRARLLTDLPYSVNDNDNTRESLIFYDTQGDEFVENFVDDDELTKAGVGGSKSNDYEARLVHAHVASLVQSGVKPEDIAVVTPYNGQLGVLSALLKDQYSTVELSSIDGFQGREKEVVIVSLVRSNSAREVGFLGEKRRLNVAMTRPKRQLCVIGDSQTISRGSEFLRTWMEFLEENADLRYPDITETICL